MIVPIFIARFLEFIYFSFKQKKISFYLYFSCILGLAPVFLSREILGEFFGDGGQDHEEPESSAKMILKIKNEKLQV